MSMKDTEKGKDAGEIQEEATEKSPAAVTEVVAEKEKETEAGGVDSESTGGGGGGWGGWGFSPLSYLSDLQKAATVAAEEISRNATAVAKSITDLEDAAQDSESSKVHQEKEESSVEAEDEDEKDQMRKAALHKLENASEESILSQGLKVIDTSVENIASEAWQTFGRAWKGGSGFLQKLELSATNLADSAQQGGGAGSVRPSLLETGKAFTAKGMQVLENVSKETMELLISETGIDVDKKSEVADHSTYDDQLNEEVTFDRCFYIYGGPEHLEELAALSSHYQLLFNRRKGKLSSEQKTFFEGRLKEIQQMFAETDASAAESDKGKKVETRGDGIDGELKSLHDASVNKAADMAAGFGNSLSGLAANDVVQRTAGRLESLHSEGAHRLTEICCFAVSQLLMLGKSVKLNSKKTADQDGNDDAAKIDWPEDCVDKAKIIKTKAQSMTASVETVANCFITGISDVAEAYSAAIKDAAKDAQENPSQKTIQEKARLLAEHLRADQTTAVVKIQDGLEYLSAVVVTTSIPSV